MSNRYDVVIVGAGPGGIFTALELIEQNPNLKIAILEKGKAVLERDRKLDVMEGFGGAGSFSDGKLIYSLDASYGGNLQQYVTDLNYFSELMKKVDDTYMKFSDNKDIKVYGEDNEKIEDIKIRAAKNGMTLLSNKVRHLGSDVNVQIMNNIYNYMKDKIDIFFDTKVSSFEKNENGFTVYYYKNNNIFFFESKYLVLMPGRVGMSWFEQQAKEHNLTLLNNQVDIGVRVEFPAWVGKDIDSVLYEPKLIIRTPKTDLRCRTFCYNVNGFVVQESVKDSNGQNVVTVNGHSNSKAGERSQNSNFALLVSSTFTEPFKEPTVYGQSVARLCNLLGNGIIVQRLKDLKNGRRSTEKRIREMNIQPSLKEATPGDIGFCLPYKQVNAILESIEILDKLFVGLNNGDTLLYAPEIKWYSSRAKINNNLESEIPNLYLGGDGTGISRSIVQASMSGMIVAKNIMEKEKCLKN